MVKAVDSDGDVAEAPLSFMVMPAEPEPEPEPIEPNVNAPYIAGMPMPIVLDEGAMEGGSGPHTEPGASGRATLRSALTARTGP